MKITDACFTDALQRFANANGRQWKSKLWDAWLTGRDYRLDDAEILRQIRNHPMRDDLLSMITTNR